MRYKIIELMINNQQITMGQVTDIEITKITAL